ncbi:MAG: hypothetical protein AAF889_10055 [Cyanobacteria bacterium P01_D01_bin.73]
MNFQEIPGDRRCIICLLESVFPVARVSGDGDGDRNLSKKMPPTS